MAPGLEGRRPRHRDNPGRSSFEAPPAFAGVAPQDDGERAELFCELALPCRNLHPRAESLLSDHMTTLYGQFGVT
jgi:hypothetical protein